MNLPTGPQASIDDDSPFGTHAPGPLRQMLHGCSATLYMQGYVGRRLAGRLRWLDRIAARQPISDVTRFGLRWRLYYPGNVSDMRLLFRPHAFEPDEIAAVLERAGPEFVLLDIGANCGFYSLRAAARGTRVIAVEPHPVMQRRLRFNASINRISSLRIIHCAVGDRAGTCRIAEGARNLGGTRLDAAGTIEVEMRTLRQIVSAENVTRIDALKVDVEGFEDRILAPFLAEAPDSLLPSLIVAEVAWKENWQSDSGESLLKFCVFLFVFLIHILFSMPGTETDYGRICSYI